MTLRNVVFILVWALVSSSACIRETRREPAPAVPDPAMPVSPPVVRIPTPAARGRTYKISIDSVQYVGGQVRVYGSTDLPDGSGVIVNFDVPKGFSEDRVGSDELVAVSRGKFRSSLVPKPEFPRSAPQVVEVMFTPRGQDPELVRQTGANGEYLTGENVSKLAGIKIIEVTRSVKLPIR